MRPLGHEHGIAWLVLTTTAQSLSWPRSSSVEMHTTQSLMDFHHTPSTSRRPGLNNRWESTLDELQSLESEPLCHRIAARLLVNNCQVLDGQNEATVLTDTGRAARDFVDFYAASLAICDLERGSFVIPRSCESFREATLSTLAVPSKAELHVPTSDINECLRGLAASDSAWNTWISYRHKALRFCEAARAENEKDSSILLYQRLTRILQGMTEGIELEMEERLRSMGDIVRQTTDNMEDILPRIDRLKQELDTLKQGTMDSIFVNAQRSSTITREGLSDVQHLRDALAHMLASVQASQTDLSASQDMVKRASQLEVSRTFNEVISSLEMVTIAVNTIKDDLTSSSTKASHLAQQQCGLEQSMLQLGQSAESLSARQALQHETLAESQVVASEVLHSLRNASVTASATRSSLSARLRARDWLPHVVGPTMSLVLGSYGLPPSMGRNLLLISLGEIAAVTFASYNEKTISNFQLPVFSAHRIWDATCAVNDSANAGQQYFRQNGSDETS